MLASLIMMMIMSPVGGGMTEKYGTRLPSGIGLICISLSCLLMSFLKDSSSYIVVIVTLLAMEAGIAFGSVMLTYRQMVYNKNTNIGANDIYLLAQRDTYYFGILILIAALILVLLLPHSIISNKKDNFINQRTNR